MNVEVRIGRIVLDGVELRRRERAALPGAIERELTALLGPARPGPRRALTAPTSATRGGRVDGIARDIALAVRGAIGGAGP
jgi:hypothetical protein